MKKIFLVLFLGICTLVMAQNTELAAMYFDKGEFEKAVVLYEEAYTKQPHAQFNYPRLLICYQELQQFAKAEKLIQERISKYAQLQVYVDLGYTYQLQNKNELATKAYNTALDQIKQNQNYVYSIAREFENRVLLDYAINAYELAISLNPDLNFDYQLSLLYGQKGMFDKMIDKILDYTDKNQHSLPMVQNMLARYMNEDANGNFSNLLRKGLLLRIQKSQEVFWSHFLSWYFVQQQEYEKAFVHEKAIFTREGSNLNKLISLAYAAAAEDKNDTAALISSFILENSQDQSIQIQLTVLKNQIALKKAKPADYPAIKSMFESQLATFGINKNALPLVLQMAKFYGFQLANFNDSKNLIDQLLKLPLQTFDLAKVKDLLADLYVSNEKFNQAIVYYAQVQDDLKNHELGHEAQFKMAQTSYFKTDFDWAQKQYKVLKQSTSLLIANDALEMFLLINDVTQQDTAKVSLTKFAKADFLKFKNKFTQAKQVYTQILKEHTGDAIEDVTLFRLAEVEKELGNTTTAIAHLEQLLTKFPESIYRDDAFYLLGNWYEVLENPAKAQENFENIILNHQDSIYFLDAQTKYRKLRGDKNI